MPETYQAERLSAKADIKAAGCPAKVRVRETNVDTACYVLILDFSFIERLGGLVIDGDAKMMLHAADVPIVSGEVHDIVIDTPVPRYAAAVGTYQIVDPHPFMIGGVPIFYNLHVRRR
jgi:hypothetical protein